MNMYSQIIVNLAYTDGLSDAIQGKEKHYRGISEICILYDMEEVRAYRREYNLGYKNGCKDRKNKGIQKKCTHRC